MFQGVQKGNVDLKGVNVKLETFKIFVSHNLVFCCLTKILFDKECSIRYISGYFILS